MDTRLVDWALSRIEGFPFERFCNDFFPALIGTEYVPLGGVRDGGADGLQEGLYEEHGEEGVYFQATVEDDVARKVRSTIARLREFGRKPVKLFLLCSSQVKYVDKLERELESELDCSISIRDRSYIGSHINADERTRGAFWQHLFPLTEDLQEVARASVSPPMSFKTKPLVHTFLAQVAARDLEDHRAAEGMTDAVVLWALEGTDHELKIYRTRDELVERVRGEVPAISKLFADRVDDRLRYMASKRYPGGRAIRYVSSVGERGAYCLPFETREKLKDELLEDLEMRKRFDASVDVRLCEYGLAERHASWCRNAITMTLQYVYEREGVEFAAFFANAEEASQFTNITDHLNRAMVDLNLKISEREIVGPAAMGVLRGILYASTAAERAYLQRISNTYALLFSLASHPDLTDYFRDVASSLVLYVGADVILRALSEYHLPPEDQVTVNALMVIAECGADLRLTEPVVEEVISHLRACDFEYKNHFKVDVVPYEIAKNAPHIMLRAYLYARANPAVRDLRSWPGFVQKFIDYEDLHKSTGERDLTAYLCHRFRLKFETYSKLAAVVDEASVAVLSKGMVDEGKDERLAYNDALMVLSVYAERSALGEDANFNNMGIRTWWLTWEKAVLRHARSIVEEHKGSTFIIRPEFVLKYISLSPESRRVKEFYSSSFTSALGLSLGRRVSPSAFHSLMAEVNKSQDLDDARREVAVAKLVDRMKTREARFFGDGRKAPVDTYSARGRSELGMAAVEDSG